MKKLFLGAIATLMLSSSAFASQGSTTALAVKNAVSAVAQGQEITKITVEMNGMANGEKVTLTFENEQALENFDFNQLNFLDAEKCEVTATVTVSVTVSAGIGVASGEVTTSVSASVTASCETIGEAVKKLAKTLRDSIK